MARQFLTLTQDDVDIKIAQALKSREHEITDYDFEQSNHEANIEKLGDIKWDDDTAKYRGMTRDQLVAMCHRDSLSDKKIKKIFDLHSIDHHKHNLQAVKAELAKCERHYEHLLTRLPEGPRREAAIAALAAKEAKEKE